MSFSEVQVQQVWGKGLVIPNADSMVWRKDRCGAWIYRSSYGKNSDYDWQIDHIKPRAQGVVMICQIYSP
jgi:hypothetical protein